MKIVDVPPEENWDELCKRPEFDTSLLQEKVRAIISAVQERGDRALYDFTKRFDGVALDELQVTASEIEVAETMLASELKTAILRARDNIATFHEAQETKSVSVETEPGIRCWRKTVPIERVGFYIPAGTAPLFSTVLMLGVPAEIAGCEDRVLCSPPLPDGSLHPAVLYAAKICNISKIYKIGGAQAIAALAFGTESVSRVDKIFGPGNQYVNCAKQLLAGQGYAIDLPAGPTELGIIADATANPVFVAADILSQAEHGPDSQVVVVSTAAHLLEALPDELERQLESLERSSIAKEALKHCLGVLVPELDVALRFMNHYAPEHLILALEEANKASDKIRHAGSVFVGHLTPESFGDYASGTNHILPTAGAARSWSGVSMESFIKTITFQEASEHGLESLGPVVEALALAEGLQGHKQAVSVRLFDRGDKR